MVRFAAFAGESAQAYDNQPRNYNVNKEKNKNKHKRKAPRIIIEEIDDSRLEEADGGVLDQGTSPVPNSNQCQCG